MWIRTQDRETLIKCDSIRISYSFCKTDEYYDLLKTYGQRAYKRINKMLGDKANKKIYHIETRDSYHILGYYDTQDRCFEVLEEIERHILNYTVKNTAYVPVVYQMPKE